MKVVHFGAGNIGRGFIGLLLSQSGYNVCFITRNPVKISLLQQRKQYTVTLANESEDSVTVNNVTAINIRNHEEVIKAVAEADLVTTAVGVSALKNIAELIARGIKRRLQQNPRPLNVIACENAIRASSKLKKLVYPKLSPEMHAVAEQFIGFPSSVVDRIVPAQNSKDPLKVRVEPFYEWILERPEMKGNLPEIAAIHYVDSLDPYIERKLFTVNTGHCSAAYLGYIEGYQTIQEVMRNPKIREKVCRVLQETGELLIKKYHFDKNQHSRYIQKVLHRFSNQSLTDKIVRVGRNPIQKLSPNERLVRPSMQAYENGLDTPNLNSVMAAALLFDYNQDEQATELQTTIEHDGVQSAITTFTGIPNRHPLHKKVLSKYRTLLAIQSH